MIPAKRASYDEIVSLFLILFFLAAGWKLSQAQDLKWQDVVAAAEKNNPELRSARSAVESSRARVGAARGEFLPALTGNGSYAKSNTATSIESAAEGRGSGATRNEYSLSLNAQQPLFSGSSAKAGLESAKSQLALARADLDLAESRIFNDLRSAFIDVLYAQENLELLKKISARKEGNKRLIGLRNEAGRENRGALLRAGAQLSQAQFEVQQAERALRVAQKRLSQAMGQDDPRSLSVSGVFEAKAEEREPDYSFLAERTPLYKAEQASLASANAGFQGAKSDFFPSLSLSGSGRRGGNDDTPGYTHSWSVAGSVSYPIFSGGRTYFNVRQAREDVLRASSDLENRRREVELALEEAFASFQNAAAQVGIQKQFLEAAEERARIARAQYNNGLVSYQDWDIIENDLTNTEKQNLESARRAVIAESSWLQVQGKGLRAIQ